MIELDSAPGQMMAVHGACMKVLGVGGAGGNAVNGMVDSREFSAIEFIVANTDAQALHLSPVATKIHIGTKITKGLGAGSNPEIGRRAAEEDIDEIIKHLTGTDILFLTAGFGGGTGTGGLPVIASVAKELGILTVAIITKPFLFEGRRRQRFAEEAIKSIKDKVDTLIVVPNQRLLEIADPKISMIDAFALSNSILKNAVKGIADILMKSGHINVDFADIKAIMKDMGMALMGTGVASGEGRARNAALNAINSPLLDNISIRGARGVLINIAGGSDLGLQELNDAATLVYDLVSEDANIILGSVIDDKMGDEVMVTVIATGFDEQPVTEKSNLVFTQRQQTLVTPVKKDTPIVSPGASQIHHVWQSQPEQVVDHHSIKHDVQVVQENSVPQALSLEQDADLGMLASSQDNVNKTSGHDLHDLDTPAFLRKQMKLNDQQPS